MNRPRRPFPPRNRRVRPDPFRRALLRAAATLAVVACGFATRGAFAAPTGLDALDDARLRNELAARDLGKLLDRAFDTANTPDAERRALRGRMALLRLRDTPLDLTATRRVVADYVAALPGMLPTLSDPASLIGDANLLIDNGVAADQSLLEYFGPAPAPMARLRPVAQAVRQLLDRAADRADAAATAAMTDWPAQEKIWDRANEQKTIAQYTRAIVAYPFALAVDPADPARDKALADALAYLSGFDTDDNPDRASVRFYAAKLNLARGTAAALAAAADGFADAIKSGRRDDVRQQFDARLLLVTVRLAQRDTAAAARAAVDFEQWARAAGLEAAQVDVAVAGIRYRTALAGGDATAADDVLDRLQRARPELRGLVLELAAARVDPTAPPASLSPLALQAVIARAENETLKPPGRPFDRPAVERGVDAARELLRRAGVEHAGGATPANADATLLDNTAYVLAFYLQKLDRPADAAAAFLDYVDAHKNAGPADRVATALDQAVAAVGGLLRTSPDEPAVTRLYDRTLRTAVAPPLSRADFQYEFGRRLQAQGKGEAAIDAYREVPTNDRNYDESRYYLMVALRQRLDALPPADASRAAALTELAGLIDTVDRTTAARIAAAADPQAKQIDRTRLAQTKLIGADVALREQKDAARAVARLDGFEPVAAGLGNEADLLGEALLLRVQAFVQLGDVGRATDQLVTLARQNPAGAGQVVYNLLKKLDEQVTAAEAAGRRDEVGRLERNRATLTPFLVTWAEHHADARIRKLTYTYRVFDADTQRRAAEGTADPAERKRLLAAALDRFTELDGEAGVRQYAESLAPTPPRTPYDPQVKLGLARTYYAQQDWAAARLQLATLFQDKVLGTGYVTSTDAAGNFQSRENPTYWEALLDLIRCNLNLGQNAAAMKGVLAEQTLLYGNDVGGQRWKAAFAALAGDLNSAATTQAVSPHG